jgi:hypothetical protein
MSATALTRQVLSNILNHTDCAPSQYQQRERCPSEKVRYQGIFFLCTNTIITNYILP